MTDERQSHMRKKQFFQNSPNSSRNKTCNSRYHGTGRKNTTLRMHIPHRNHRTAKMSARKTGKSRKHKANIHLLSPSIIIIQSQLARSIQVPLPLLPLPLSFSLRNTITGTIAEKHKMSYRHIRKRSSRSIIKHR